VKSARVIPHLRWYICGLLFFATTVNYIDRQVRYDPDLWVGEVEDRHDRPWFDGPVID